MLSTREFAEQQNQLWDEAQQLLALELRALPRPSASPTPAADPKSPDTHTQLANIILSLKRLQDARYGNDQYLREHGQTQSERKPEGRKRSSAADWMKELLQDLDQADDDDEALCEAKPNKRDASPRPQNPRRPSPPYQPANVLQHPRTRDSTARQPPPILAGATDQSRGAPAPAAAMPKPKTGRNDPCPCGSGKKYKRCCLAHDQTDLHEQARTNASATINSSTRNLPAGWCGGLRNT